MTTTAKKSTARAEPTLSPTPLPALPPDLDGWQWEQLNDTLQLRAPDDWRTNWYARPDRAIAEAKRRVLSTPKARPIEAEPTAIAAPQSIPLDQIRTDGGTQARAGLDTATVNDYADAYADLARQRNGLDLMPPVVLFYDGEAYWLADGFHRLAAYRQFLEAVPLTAAPHALPARVEAGTRRDAVLYAAGANADHGLRRTTADKERAVLALLRDEEWSQWSDREIARRCRVSHGFVRNVTERHGLSTGRASSERRTADGRTMQTAGIGAANRERATEPDDAAAFEDARRRFALLGYKLERHGAWFKLSTAHGSHYATTPDLAPQLNTLRTFEAGARKRADAAASAWVCEVCGQPQTGMKEPTPPVCTNCAMERLNQALQPAAQPAQPLCGDCGERDATHKQQIDGVLMHRCDPCAARARARVALTPLCERAEALGATIDYIEQREDGRMRVLPLAGFQQAWLWGDAGELAQFCGAWDRGRHGWPNTEAPAVWGWGPTMAALRECQHAVFNKDRDAALRAGVAFVDALARDNPHAYAVRLLRTLAPLMAGVRPESLEDLSQAISDLNECEEGSEGQHWVRVGWALLDVEAPEGAGVPTLESEGIV